jgi:hypothetical protein
MTPNCHERSGSMTIINADSDWNMDVFASIAIHVNYIHFKQFLWQLLQ